MRMFVALEIPQHLRDELERRARVSSAGLPKARRVRAEAMHLTLAFLGETEEGVLPDLHRELGSAFAGAPVLTLRLGENGVFPPRGKARVIWTGIVEGDGAEPEALSALQPAVAEAVERGASIALDKRPFHPHVTLARCSPPWARGAVERFLEGFGDPPAETFEVEEGVLFESELRPSGARYRVVETYPLGGSP